MQINTRELSLLVQEANVLSSKRDWSKQDERRNAFLLSAIAAIKAGASLAELEQDNFNSESRRNGLPTTNFKRDRLTVEQRDTATVWQHFIRTPKEQRNVEGSPIPRLGSYTGLGHFIPTQFFDGVFAQMKAHDPLFDEDACTVLNTTNGRVMTVPTIGDCTVEASIVGEGGSQSESDIAVIGQAVLGTYAWKSPRWSISMEAFQDMQGTVNAVNIFKGFASDRLRRAIGKKLINGSGTNEPLGLIPAITALGSTATEIIHAEGSAANTGGAETGANSIGSKDIANLFYSVNSSYRTSAKCAWLMNDSTLNFLAGIVDKMGHPIVHWFEGLAFLLGKRVLVSPSMDDIGSSQVPIAFGDLSYWVTRIVTGEVNGFQSQYIQQYTEAPDLIENGMIGLRAFLRAGGALAVNDPDSPSPINYIRNLS